MLADGFVGCEPFEVLEPAAEIVGGDEVAEMLQELIMALVVMTLDGVAHPFDLAVRPRVPGLGPSVLDIKVGAARFEGVASLRPHRLDVLRHPVNRTGFVGGPNS